MPTGSNSVAQLLTPERVRVGYSGSTKEELIDGLVDLLSGVPEVRRLEVVRGDVWKREEQMSTGVGKGLALPHARTEAVSDTVGALAVTADPVDFDSIDGQPVRIVLLMVGPVAARARHVALLGRISRLVNRDDFRDALLEASDPNAVIEIIREAEKGLDV